MEQDFISFFQKQLKTNSTTISHEILYVLYDRYPNDYNHLQEAEKETRENIIDELVTTLANLLDQDSSHSEEVAKDLGKKLGYEVLSRGIQLSVYLNKISVYKEVLWRFIDRQAQKQPNMSSKIVQIITIIDQLFNHVVHGFSLAYAEDEQRRLNDYEEKYLKLSTPIVPITDNVAILPIIGEIDEKRASVLIDETLQESNKLDIDWLVIDLSGVYHVDDLFVNHLQKLLESINILGISPILTGLRPDLSMRAIQNGIFLGQEEEVIIKPNLKVAIEMFK